MLSARSGRSEARDPASRWLIGGIVAAIVVGGCGPSDTPLADLGSPDGEIGHDELVEICEQLREADLPDGIDESTFDELVGAYRLSCDEVGVLLPPGTGGPVCGHGRCYEDPSR